MTPRTTLILTLVAILCVCCEGSLLEAGLVGYWSFEATDSSGNYLDASGNGNTAVNSGATSATGKIGSAAYFNGSAILTAADSTSLDSATGAGQDRTVAFWFKYTTTGNRVVLEKGENRQLVVQTESGTSSKISFRVDSPNTTRPISVSAVNDDTFHHFAATYNGAANLMELFIDGAWQGAGVQVAPADNDYPLAIGARVGPIAPYIGTLDDVALWNQRLSSAQIKALSQGITTPLTAAQRIDGVTYRYASNADSQPAGGYPDTGTTELTDVRLGSTSWSDAAWVGFRDPAGGGGDSGLAQPQIDFDLQQFSLVDGVRIDYLVDQGGGINAPDGVDVLAYQDAGYTTLLQSTTSTAFENVNGVRSLTFAFDPVGARYLRLAFHNDREWTFLSEVTFFQLVPEPSSLALTLGAGVMAIAWVGRRRQRLGVAR
jgi:hypothetical protein